jgi:hypothetical protein
VLLIRGHPAVDALISFGLSLCVKDTVRPHFRAIDVGIGVAGGWLALGCLVALMRVPSIAAMYTAYLGLHVRLLTGQLTATTSSAGPVCPPLFHTVD